MAEEQVHQSSKEIITLKFRPQNFDEFIGQPQVTIPLINAIKSGKIHHAYLFYGPRGIGKTSTARILAKMLNCETGPTPTPCSECTNCKEITAGISPDVIEIDGASNRGINEIRNLQENLIYAPIKSRFKIYIIDEVHMLTKEAFNALLKTLEEPPEHVVFIFATTEIHKVLPTIRSRCQQYQFNLFKLTEITGQIEKVLEYYGIEYEPKVPFLIGKHGNGSMRDALSILSQVIAYNDRKISEADVNYLLGVQSFDFISTLFDALLAHDYEMLYTILSRMYHKGTNIDNIAQQLLEYLRIIALIKNNIEDINILNEASIDPEKIRRQGERLTLKQLSFMAQKLIDFQKNAPMFSNPYYVFENLIITFSFDDFYISPAEVVRKLEEVKNEIRRDFSITEQKPQEIVVAKREKVVLTDEHVMNRSAPKTATREEPAPEGRAIPKNDEPPKKIIDDEFDRLLRIEEPELQKNEKNVAYAAPMKNETVPVAEPETNSDKNAAEIPVSPVGQAKDIIKENGDRDGKLEGASRQAAPGIPDETRIDAMEKAIKKKIDSSGMPDEFKRIASLFDGEYSQEE